MSLINVYSPAEGRAAYGQGTTAYLLCTEMQPEVLSDVAGFEPVIKAAKETWLVEPRF